MKNFRRQIGLAGLINDAEFALLARMIVALAFVPIDDLEVAFAALSRELQP